jgi:hypothetical protein
VVILPVMKGGYHEKVSLVSYSMKHAERELDVRLDFQNFVRTARSRPLTAKEFDRTQQCHHVYSGAVFQPLYQPDFLSSLNNPLAKVLAQTKKDKLIWQRNTVHITETNVGNSVRHTFLGPGRMLALMLALSICMRRTWCWWRRYGGY